MNRFSTTSIDPSNDFGGSAREAVRAMVSISFYLYEVGSARAPKGFPWWTAGMKVDPRVPNTLIRKDYSLVNFTNILPVSTQALDLSNSQWRLSIPARHSPSTPVSYGRLPKVFESLTKVSPKYLKVSAKSLPKHSQLSKDSFVQIVTIFEKTYYFLKKTWLFALKLGELVELSVF